MNPEASIIPFNIYAMALMATASPKERYGATVVYVSPNKHTVKRFATLEECF